MIVANSQGDIQLWNFKGSWKQNNHFHVPHVVTQLSFTPGNYCSAEVAKIIVGSHSSVFLYQMEGKMIQEFSASSFAMSPDDEYLFTFDDNVITVRKNLDGVYR